MKTSREIETVRALVREAKGSGKTVGFVPTMGNLHEGHLSLIRESVRENPFTVLSIYVNPTQFGPKEDFKNYPRTLDRDLTMAEKAGCDLVFIPTDETMYGPLFSTYVSEENLSVSMCGERRPGHFRGVTTVVTKLFNIIKPDTAYFGQKDAQQALVIRRMVTDLNFDIGIRVLPTVREKSGLAMSSRNNYLSESDRERAAIISRALLAAKKAYGDGERSSSRIIKDIRTALSKERDISVDYIEIRAARDLSPIKTIDRETLVAVGASFRGVHLIDNIILADGEPRP